MARAMDKQEAGVEVLARSRRWLVGHLARQPGSSVCCVAVWARGRWTRVLCVRWDMGADTADLAHTAGSTIWSALLPGQRSLVGRHGRRPRDTA